MLAARVALLTAAACASGSGDDAALADYFAVARTIWPATTSAGRCLRVQEAEGWAAKGASSSFKTAGVEGVGHHWLEGLDRSLCGGKRCGGQQSFSACGGCCKVSTTKDAVAYAKAPQRARRGHAWRCFSSDKPNYPKRSKSRHHVVLVRDVLATHESILRRFWKWDARPGGGVDTLAREETALGKAMAKLEGHAFDCRRTLCLSFDHARRHPAAHAAAMARFLGVPSASKLRAFFAKTAAPANGTARIDCVARNKAPCRASAPTSPGSARRRRTSPSPRASRTRAAPGPRPRRRRVRRRRRGAAPPGGGAPRAAPAALAWRYPTVAAVPPLTSCA
ncbi:hypothetical protein JL720_235 [Aureococcus anophagefferens]|nr:hypothetical protein JL720_235 [Aureococcus anophagefferens]